MPKATPARLGCFLFLLILHPGLASAGDESTPELVLLDRPGLPPGTTDRPIAEVERLAAAGDVDAMNELGDRYLFRVAVSSHDNDLALKWYRKAADAGSGYAMQKVGGMHRDGLGTEVDFGQAFVWFKRALAAGDVSGHASIGFMHYYGLGVPASKDEARKHYEAGVEANDPNAMNNLGHLYRFGEGVEKDVRRAARLFERGAKLNNTFAMTNLAELLLLGDEGVAKDERRGFELQQRAASLGDPGAMYSLASNYHTGRFVEKNQQKAVQWLNWAAGRNHTLSMVTLANFYLDGEQGLEVNPIKSAELLREAAELDDPEAMRLLGHMIRHGVGTKADPVAAVEWYRRAAESGDVEAMWELSTVLLNGEHVETNVREAARWIHQAAELGHPKAKAMIEKAVQEAGNQE